MPSSHKIDHESHLIITRWLGEPSDEDLLEAFKRYNQKFKSKLEFTSYNELVVFGSVEGARISINGLKMLVEFAQQSDRPGVQTKLAFVVTTNLAYGLARMYSVYRSLNLKRPKEIQVFKNQSDAMTWLTN